ncbi:MAG: DNA polymerase III subunit delta [Hyphomonadaceae bacterium]|nr:DNA polymerase III subunit delta [Hyphomonadaceae bacterium]
MVAVKAHQAEAFLKALERVPPAVLFYGSDAGLVSERAASLARRLAEREGGEVLRLDDADLETEPARISIELRTVAMFGGRKIVRATAGRRINANALKPLVEAGEMEGFLIVEAGNLRPDEGLRALFEKASGAAAVACFPDEARDLDAMVGEVLRAAGVEIAPEARKLLLTRLGADRALSRAEVEKLALFARGGARIGEADVEAVVGDAAELALDRIVLAAGSGRGADAVTECDRIVAAGESAQGVIAALQRHFLRLHRLRSGHDAGRSLDEVMRALRPAPHFKQKAEIEQQCRNWDLARLNAALARIGDAALAARRNSALESTLAEHLLLELGALAQDKRKRA